MLECNVFYFRALTQQKRVRHRETQYTACRGRVEEGAGVGRAGSFVHGWSRVP